MTTPDTSAYLALLQAQRNEVLSRISALRGGDVGRAQASEEHFARSQGSDARRASEQELELALDEHETQELASIDAAIARLHAGNYGECIDCGTAIAPARLHAAPAAQRCLQCQERAEQSL